MKKKIIKKAIKAVAKKKKVEKKKEKMKKPYVKTKYAKDKIEKVMHEFKEGDLHSGSKKGPKVKNRKQAVAIALSESRHPYGKKKKKK